MANQQYNYTIPIGPDGNPIIDAGGNGPQSTTNPPASTDPLMQSLPLGNPDAWSMLSSSVVKNFNNPSFNTQLENALQAFTTFVEDNPAVIGIVGVILIGMAFGGTGSKRRY